MPKASRGPVGHDGGVEPDDPLSDKEARFCIEYLLDLCAAKAAIRAGYAPSSARNRGYRLMQRPRIQERIREEYAARCVRTELAVDTVMQDIAGAARLDIGRLFDDQGRLLAPRDLPEDVRRAIVSIEVATQRVEGGGPGDVEYVHKIRLIDKGRMHELLARHTGALREDQPNPADAHTPAFILPAGSHGPRVH